MRGWTATKADVFAALGAAVASITLRVAAGFLGVVTAFVITESCFAACLTGMAFEMTGVRAPGAHAVAELQPLVVGLTEDMGDQDFFF